MTELRTLSSRLERDHFHDRARRIERVLVALRDRDVSHRADGGRTPEPLRSAIADFSVELGGLKRRLSKLR